MFSARFFDLYGFAMDLECVFKLIEAKKIVLKDGMCSLSADVELKNASVSSTPKKESERDDELYFKTIASFETAPNSIDQLKGK